MAKNYAAGTPIGNNEVPIYNSPAPVQAIEQYYSANAVASSVVTLTDNTTAIEIAAGANPVIMRWVSVADASTAATSVIALPSTSANFDHIVPANTVRRLVVPIERATAQGYSSMQGVNRDLGLFQRVAFKSEVVSSVYVSEYGSSNTY